MRWNFLGRPGYPGWHLECSTIIHQELGEPIDIHTGGIDHIPIHHTNEIAQTFGAFQKKLAEFWLHCNFLTINGEKISKSLGNIITLKDLEEKGFSVFDFKLWLYQGHYRSERNFTWEDLASAKIRRKNWQNAYILSCQRGKTSQTPSLESKLLEYLNDDLNSPAAFAYIDSIKETLTSEDWELIDEIFKLNLTEIKNNSNWSFSDYESFARPLINKRNFARAQKNYQTADQLREELSKKGLTLLDTSEGTFWQLEP